MKKLLLAILLAVGTYCITFFGVDLVHKQSLLLSIIVLLITLWTNEGLPIGPTSLLPIILFPLLGLGELKQIAQNYSHSIIFLFIGGFLIALAFEKTRLHLIVAHKMIEIFPPTPRGKMYALMITSALLSAVLSNTTITLMLMPIVLFLAPPEKGSKRLTIRFLLATAFGASIGGVLTPIGTPPNLVLLGFLEQNQLKMFSFTGWIFKLLPVVTIMLIITPYFLSIGFSHINSLNNNLDLGKPRKNSLEDAKDEKNFSTGLDKSQRKLTVIILLLVGLLFLNSKYGDFYSGLGISEAIILLGFGLILFLPGINLLEWEDTIKIPWEIIFLFGAGFSIADTLIQSGLPAESVKYFQRVKEMPIGLLIFVIALMVSLCTQITSNTAFISIALPIFYQFSITTGLDSELILTLATVATSYAFMLPIATPPNAIIMSSQIIKVKTMVKYGFVVNMIGVIVISLVAYLIW